MSKDLNLLKVFVAAAEELNLTRASKRLGLSQPALSHALRRLRDELGDPLLVRGSRGLVPTERAKELLPRAREALARVEELYAPDEARGIARAGRRFVLAATTYYELRVLNPLLSRLATEAPGVTLETRPLQEGFPKEALERGELDLAIAAYFERLPESFRMKVLGRDPHVGVARKGHPFLRTKRALEDYLAARHVRIAVPPGRPQKVDELLARKGRSRRIVAELSNFLTPACAVAGTDCLLTCPETLARRYAEMLPLEVFELPLAVPPVEIKMAWHERAHADPLNRWVRDALSAR